MALGLGISLSTTRQLCTLERPGRDLSTPGHVGKGPAQALQWPHVFNFSLSDVVGYFLCLQLSAALQPAVNISVGPAGLLF